MNDSDKIGLLLDDLYLGEGDVVYHDVAEHDDYLLCQDPLDPENEESWAVVLLKDPYKNWVVRFVDGIFLDKGELEFTYEVLYTPEFDGEFTDVELANYLSSVLAEVLASLHETEGQVYVDTKTGEQVVDY